MKNRKPTIIEQKVQLKAAREETLRRATILESDLVELIDKLKTYPEGRQAPKGLVTKIVKARTELGLLQLNLQSINNTEKRLGLV